MSIPERQARRSFVRCQPPRCSEEFRKGDPESSAFACFVVIRDDLGIGLPWIDEELITASVVGDREETFAPRPCVPQALDISRLEPRDIALFILLERVWNRDQDIDTHD